MTRQVLQTEITSYITFVFNMTQQGFQTEVTLPALYLLVKARPSKRSYFLHSFFLQKNTTNPSNRSNCPHRFCFQNDTASQFSNRIYTSCIAAVSKMTRQILQTITTSPHRFCFQNDAAIFLNRIYTSCIVSVSKMTRQILQTGATSRIASASKIASLQTSFGSLFVTHSFLPHGGEMNAWRTNPKGRLRVFQTKSYLATLLLE